MMSGHGLAGHVNLEAEPLAPPQWDITLDKERAEQTASELTREYDEWNREFEHIMEDWQTDSELLNNYYWRYELEPHLEKGQKLDEKTLRSVVTYIVDNT